VSAAQVAFNAVSSTNCGLYVGSNDVAAANPFVWASGAVLDVTARVILA
jgi:hypothetical protein